MSNNERFYAAMTVFALIGFGVSVITRSWEGLAFAGICALAGSIGWFVDNRNRRK